MTPPDTTQPAPVSAAAKATQLGEEIAELQATHTRLTQERTDIAEAAKRHAVQAKLAGQPAPPGMESTLAALTDDIEDVERHLDVAREVYRLHLDIVADEQKRAKAAAVQQARLRTRDILQRQVSLLADLQQLHIELVPLAQAAGCVGVVQCGAAATLPRWISVVRVALAASHGD